MSMKDMEGPKSSESQPSSASVPMDAGEDDEEEELQRALALSMAAAAGSDTVDPELVNQLLGESDISDPLIQAALEQLKAQNNTEENKDDKEDKSKKRKSDDI